jgi:hypothetical protein
MIVASAATPTPARRRTTSPASRSSRCRAPPRDRPDDAQGHAGPDRPQRPLVCLRLPTLDDPTRRATPTTTIPSAATTASTAPSCWRTGRSRSIRPATATPTTSRSAKTAASGPTTTAPTTAGAAGRSARRATTAARSISPGARLHRHQPQQRRGQHQRPINLVELESRRTRTTSTRRRAPTTSTAGRCRPGRAARRPSSMTA